MRPYWVGLMGRFGLKTGIHFAHSGLEWGMVFGGTRGVYEGTDLSFQFQMSKKKEKYANSK